MKNLLVILHIKINNNKVLSFVHNSIIITALTATPTLYI